MALTACAVPGGANGLGPYNTMMISRFFFPEPLPPAGEVRLPDGLAHHATKVLRLRDGDALVLFDGRGAEVEASLVARGRAWFAALGVHSEPRRESPLQLVLVQALVSAEKMDWIVQKAVELGVVVVVPVHAERSVARLAGERAVRKHEHWRQVAISACEQSGRNRIPRIEPVAALEDYLVSNRQVHDKLLLAPQGEAGLARLERPHGPLHVLVGPEGGWSDRELVACDTAGCRRIGLGPRVLRTETAGLAAMSAAQVLWGDF